MRWFAILRKGALCAPFFFSSCSKPCPQWEFQNITSSCPHFNAGKISLYPENPGSGLELEIARTSDDLRMYLNVFSLGVCPLAENKVPVVIIISDHRYEVLADVFQGGQRFLLPAEIYTPILEALFSDEMVTISVGRYRENIFGSGFQTAHASLFRV
jgi:hypothetical protein